MVRKILGVLLICPFLALAAFILYRIAITLPTGELVGLVKAFGVGGVVLMAVVGFCLLYENDD